MKFCLRCLWFLWVFSSGSWSFLSVRRKTLEFPQVRLVHFYKLEPDFCPCVVFDTFTLGKNVVSCFQVSTGWTKVRSSADLTRMCLLSQVRPEERGLPSNFSVCLCVQTNDPWTPQNSCLLSLIPNF